MNNTVIATILPDEVIIKKIHFFRNHKVILDKDLAEMYGVETRVLKQAVRRNINRFPKRYMFELTAEEASTSRSQIVTLKRGENLKYLPYAFTEHGVLMLANVLKSKSAIEVSMRIIDVFILLREQIEIHEELRHEIEVIKQKVNNQSKNIELVFQYLDELIEKRENPTPRIPIGFKLSKKK